MRKTLLILVVISNLNYSHSQSLENKIALKACECLKKNKEITEDIYRNCLTTAMTEVVFADKDPKVRETINTVDGIQNLLKKSNEAMIKNCPELFSKKPESKSDIFYADSKIKSAQNSYIIGKDFMQNQKYDLAIEALKIALKEDPKFVLAYDDIAVCYRQLNDYDNAIKYYKKSLEIFPEGDYALMNIGVVYTLKKDYKTAIEYYEKLIKYQPANAEGYFGAGKNYMEINNNEKALQNILTAHRIYTESKSEYTEHTNIIIGAIYQKMKADNKEDAFKKIAAENNIKIE
jgi:tetratricopeptide (TPR) repeat protein